MFIPRCSETNGLYGINNNYSQKRQEQFWEKTRKADPSYTAKPCMQNATHFATRYTLLYHFAQISRKALPPKTQILFDVNHCK